MQVTNEHIRRAEKLAAPWPSACTVDAPAAQGYLAAVERIEMPGDLGEYAKTRWAVIENEGDPVNVHVEHWEEGIAFTEDDLTALAFDLLALRDLAATSRAMREPSADE